MSGLRYLVAFGRACRPAALFSGKRAGLLLRAYLDRRSPCAKCGANRFRASSFDAVSNCPDRNDTWEAAIDVVFLRPCAAFQMTAWVRI